MPQKRVWLTTPSSYAAALRRSLRRANPRPVPLAGDRLISLVSAPQARDPLCVIRDSRKNRCAPASRPGSNLVIVIDLTEEFNCARSRTGATARRLLAIVCILCLVLGALELGHELPMAVPELGTLVRLTRPRAGRRPARQLEAIGVFGLNQQYAIQFSEADVFASGARVVGEVPSRGLLDSRSVLRSPAPAR